MRTFKGQKIEGKILDLSVGDQNFLSDIYWDVDVADDYRCLNNDVKSEIENMFKRDFLNEAKLSRLDMMDRNIRKARVIFAHAGGFPWIIYDNGLELSSAQKWVNLHSKSYDSLFIEGCNPFKQIPVFRGAPIHFSVGICGTPGEYEARVIDKPNKCRAVVSNLANAFRKHSYWGGESVYKLS